jgi:hypothetical protein
MKKKIRRRRCKNCQELYKPDLRHLKRQKFCHKPACKSASKTYSQYKWLDKPDNRDYFSGPEHVTRVQEWRKINPGYWKRSKRLKKPYLIENTLQEMKSGQSIANKGSSIDLVQIALQDSISAKSLFIIGFDIHLNEKALKSFIDIIGQGDIIMETNIPDI